MDVDKIVVIRTLS